MPDHGQPQAEDEQNRPRKRPKIALACSNCRSRKVRCSGDRPHCTTCVARREVASCSYLPATTTDMEGLPYLPNSSPGTHGNAAFTYQPPIASSEELPLPQAIDWNGNAITRPPSQTSPWNSARSSHGPSPAQASNNASGAGSSLLARAEPGLSSTGGFLRTLLGTAGEGAASSRLTRVRPSAARSLGDLGIRDELQTAPIRSENMLLPPRREINRLLQVYRTIHYPIFPLLNFSSLNVDVDTLFQGTTTAIEERTLLCMLNLIFAMSTQSEHETGAPEENPADAYFKRGQELLCTDVLHGYSFAQLQTILLCAQHLLSSDKPTQCWILVGLSIRIAESLGLDRSSTSNELKTVSERDLARRIWHVCVAMDRAVAMCLGQRPSLTAHATSFIRLDTVSELSTGTLAEQENNISHAFFTASSDLFDILYSILVRVYVPEDRNPAEKLTISPSFTATVVEIEESLAIWNESLPGAFHATSETPDRAVANMLQPACFLRQRYLQVAMMLYRPGLAAFAMNQSQSKLRTLKASAFLHAATACVSCAKEMVELCKKQAHARFDSHLRTPWWMNILYCYTAAVAIAAAILKGCLDGNLESTGLMESIQDATCLLRHYAESRPSARRCLATLTSILQVGSHTVHSTDQQRSVQLSATDQVNHTIFYHGDAESTNIPMDMSWTMPIGAEHTGIDLLTDQWLMQPQLDSFNYLGI